MMNRGGQAGHRRSMRLGSRGGFALLEVLIAMMTLAAIAIIFVGSVVLAEKTAHVNGQYAQAISLCQHKIDQCRAVGYGRLNHTELNDAEIVDGYPTTLPYQFDVVDDVANYLPSPSVCEVNVTPAADPDISVVTVTLTWRNAKHRTKTSTVSLSALISNVE